MKEQKDARPRVDALTAPTSNSFPPRIAIWKHCMGLSARGLAGSG
jgi:hypothetical protein